MKTTTSKNKTTVTFTVMSFGNTHVDQINTINNISKKYNAQVMLFNNISHLKLNKHGNLIGFQIGSTGGTITFHSHSCDHNSASFELIGYLESLGYKNEKFQEVEKTHRLDGTFYKKPQIFIEKI